MSALRRRCWPRGFCPTPLTLTTPSTVPFHHHRKSRRMPARRRRPPSPRDRGFITVISQSIQYTLISSGSDVVQHPPVHCKRDTSGGAGLAVPRTHDGLGGHILVAPFGALHDERSLCGPAGRHLARRGPGRHNRESAEARRQQDAEGAGPVAHR